MRLLIGVPTHGMWEPDFGHSLALTMADLAAGNGPETMRLVRAESSKLASGRTDIVRDALANDATHILWCDTDMTFRPSNVRALLAHDLDIVAADYAKKTASRESVCAALDGTILKPGNGVELVAHAGMGLMLTKSDVFSRVPEPWFQFRWNEKTGEDIGEDVWFCRRAREAGVNVHIDHDASAGIGHVGKFTFYGDR